MVANPSPGPHSHHPHRQTQRLSQDARESLPGFLSSCPWLSPLSSFPGLDGVLAVQEGKFKNRSVRCFLGSDSLSVLAEQS